ncbi:hypothetical protein ENTB43_201 [Enterobacter phage Entb_43]|nr:hypothetical protein [Enterobacter phage vB-EclM_KMB19]UVD32622.1 hypothetical protein ENTB43_201 [Enterobacter phage Entb_43]
MKFFVKDASFLAKIKKTQLRKLLWMGARHKTPLNRKITAEPFYRIINDKLVVTSVKLFAPGTDGMPAWKFDLNEQTYITDSDWHLMFEPVANYERWYGIRMEEDYKRDLIDKLIEAASIYGQVKSNCANGFISDVEGAMRPVGKDVREIRKSLYEALGL